MIATAGHVEFLLITLLNIFRHACRRSFLNNAELHHLRTLYNLKGKISKGVMLHNLGGQLLSPTREMTRLKTLGAISVLFLTLCGSWHRFVETHVINSIQMLGKKSCADNIN